MRLALFEDSGVEGLAPLTLARPVFELRCGRMTLRGRLRRRIQPCEWGALMRGYLAEAYAEAQPECHVNDIDWLAESATLLVNGRWLPPAEWEPLLDPTVAGRVDETVVYVTATPEDVSVLRGCPVGEWIEFLAQRRHGVRATGTLLGRPWDLVDRNSEQLRRDFECLTPATSPTPRPLDSDVRILGSRDQVHLDPSARLDPYVVLDAREGPITVDADVRVLPFTRLEGPCHVGRSSELFRAHVRGGTTIGPVCRVGGEIEASILHGYVNKYHEGFLGHSYLCPWVNLGAGTTTSDLKSDYSAVWVPLDGEPIDSGLTKVGSFIGDHTKTALGCLFNTGSSIGVWCTILPAGPLLPKHIPSFTSIWNGCLSPGLDFDRLADAARIAMGRRGCVFTDAQRRLYRNLFDLTTEERERAIHRIAIARTI